MEQQHLISKEDSPRRVRMQSSPATSAVGVHLINKKVIVFLVSAVAVLGCALAMNLVHIYGRPAITAETASTGTQEEDYLSMPPAAAAAPLRADPAMDRAPPVESAAPLPRPAAVLPAAVAETGEPVDIAAFTQYAAGEDDSSFGGNGTQQIEHRCLEPVQMTLCPVNASRVPNRFRSLGHCRAACQGQGARAECREPVRLVSCRREHVKRSWFYPANGSCVEWGFPEGSCVNVRLRLFQSMQQCLLDCVQHDAPACREYPVGQRCGEYQVNYPVYSAANKNGRFECLTVDPADRLCLLGPNMFPSYRACTRACLVS
ncbi:hypothetical protein MRX96_011021 [Rhipicephalus microplus]